MAIPAELIIFEPWEAYEVIKGMVSKVPVRFIAKDGRSFWLYPNFGELLTRWRAEGEMMVTVYDGRTRSWIGLGSLRKKDP